MAEESPKIIAVEKSSGDNAMTLAAYVDSPYSEDTKIWSYLKH